MPKNLCALTSRLVLGYISQQCLERAEHLLIFPTVIYMILLYYIHSSVCPTQECKGDCYTSRKKGKESISGYITLSMLYKEYIYYL